MVAEIQQSSNNTFRLFDWNRTGPDGKPRKLHVAEALEAIDYTQAAIRPQRPRATASAHVERLVHCDKFVLDRWTLSCLRPAGGDDRCHVLTVVQGSVSVEGDPSGRPLDRGRTVLLPAAAGTVGLTSLGDPPAIVLDAYLP